MTTNFIPKRRLISAVTQAEQCTVTTTENHGYTIGQTIRIIIPGAYGMTVDGELAKVVSLPAETQFVADLDTSKLNPFVAPSAPPSFTQAQVVPVSGTWDNDTSLF